MALTLQQQVSENSDKLVNATNNAKTRDTQNDTTSSQTITSLQQQLQAAQDELAQYKTDNEALLSLTNDKMVNCANVMDTI